MFRIKICGIRSVIDEQVAARCGADAVGLNFCPDSRRYLDQIARRAFEQRFRGGPLRVGVFVNELPEVIRKVSRKYHLDAIQLHGEEPAAVVAQLAPLPVIRAFRSGPDCVKEVADFLHACKTAKCELAGVLMDAAGGGSCGGTGELADWASVARLRPDMGGVPLILAGGLTSLNVERAISAVKPFGVDVATGVEIDGLKEADLVQQFVEAAKRGLSAT